MAYLVPVRSRQALDLALDRLEKRLMPVIYDLHSGQYEYPRDEKRLTLNKLSAIMNRLEDLKETLEWEPL